MNDLRGGVNYIMRDRSISVIYRRSARAARAVRTRQLGRDRLTLDPVTLAELGELAARRSPLIALSSATTRKG